MENGKFDKAKNLAEKSMRGDNELEKVVPVCNLHLTKVEGVRDLYKVLEVERFSVDMEKMKANFRKIAKAIHPDKNTYPGTNEAFVILHEARDVLLNAKKKKEYDKKLKNLGVKVKLVDYSSTSSSD